MVCQGGDFNGKIRMMNSQEKLFYFYEDFHGRIKFQKKVIERKNFTYRLIIDILDLYLVNSQKVLDIGCGVGTLSFYIASKGNYVKGIDISLRAIEACKITAKELGLIENTNFSVTDFSKETLEGKSDLVICSEVLEHLRDDKLAVRKVFNILKEDGKVLISVPSKNSPLFRLGLTKKFDERVGHLRRYNRDEMSCLLKKTGFEILKVKEVEGVLRNSLFVFTHGSIFVRIANRFTIVSDILTFLDNITLKLFGESQIIVVAQKPRKERK
jgi:2-polyprenyl-3-methyl-5-hydroxy-6-metoxy-1,4-benzoquinol methylase